MFIDQEDGVQSTYLRSVFVVITLLKCQFLPSFFSSFSFWYTKMGGAWKVRLFDFYACPGKQLDKKYQNLPKERERERERQLGLKRQY